MSTDKVIKKDKNQNIQVFVRLRPLNQRERDIKSLGVIDVLNNREVLVRQSQQNSYTKKFTFDRAFNPNAKQMEVYQEVVSPLIEEVLAGYNCTVFAYGQTGTGKTHTMVGESTGIDTNWQNDPLAGIIPRALSQLFDELRISATEHSVRVSYLELYNEELFDLLSSSEDNSKLRIYEDVTRKGSNIVNGLEEISVSNKNEVYKIMTQGQERKKVASTLMNAQSSRSHTVFTIVVHMKENSPEGEELVKIGKLNLVDLAGSENISKAGSDNPAKKERARECVNINQSLLTLGRVITALVEKHPHIPYRESKLTRILQESLGGRTKTSIIATISPGHKDLEETMSTLEYANRAKNIQNKPEVNQKMTKKAIMKQYAEEIDRLKKDLQAARDKNGVFLSNDTYTELTLKQEEQRKEIQELLLKQRALEEEKDKMENVFTDMNKTLEKKDLALNAKDTELMKTRTKLVDTNNTLRTTQMECEERAHLIEKHQATETTLNVQAKEVLAAADVATTHVRCLHDTVDRRRNIECSNLQVTRTYSEQSSDQRANIVVGARHFVQTLADNMTELHTAMENLTSTSKESLQKDKAQLQQIVDNTTRSMEEIQRLITERQNLLNSATASHREKVHLLINRGLGSVEPALTSVLQIMAGCVDAAQANNSPDCVANCVNQWYEGARERVESLQRSLKEYNTKLAETDTARTDAARKQRDGRLAGIDRCIKDVNEIVAEMEEEKAECQSNLALRQADIEVERRDTETRLQLWVEEEMKCFEERLQAHVQSESAAMEIRLAKREQDINSERSRLEASFASKMESYRSLLSDYSSQLEQIKQEQTEEDAGSERSGEVVAGYSKAFDHGAAAVTAEMESVCRNVVEVAQQAYTELLGTLLRAKAQLQQVTQTAATQLQEASEHLRTEVTEHQASVVQECEQAVESTLDKIETFKTSTNTVALSLAASSDVLQCSVAEHSASHAARVQGVTSRAATYEQQLCAAVQSHAELEGRYLSEEYKVYSPTGATPQRTEYRYPRSFAATSPHERILARFRAMKQNDMPEHVDDDDCIVVDSDSESRQTSDGESSVSEDPCVFAATSPPGALVQPLQSVQRKGPPTTQRPRDVKHNGIGIMKCTSESDISTIRMNQEQQSIENADNSITSMNGRYKKPSKLRAPFAHKKPLGERNCYD